MGHDEGCVCNPEYSNGHRYIQWIGSAFRDCVYTPLDQASFALGLAVIGFWLFAQAPQLYKNYKSQKAEALSIYFLCEWFSGDVCNLVGCILTNQLPTQLFTAIYFCCIDAVTILQYAYYQYGGREKYIEWQSQRDVANGKVVEEKKALLVDNKGNVNKTQLAAVLFSVAALGGWMMYPTFNTQGELYGGRQLLENSERSPCMSQTEQSLAVEIIGSVIAWISGVLYFTSRMPQVYRNFKRGSCEGL
eukprot:Colp12_sorted_trinity150504_noHs@6942